MCTNTSSTYQTFSLASPLILSVSSPQVSDFSNHREISSTNPITITGTRNVQFTIYFPSEYQIMEVHLSTTEKLQYFSGRTSEEKPPTNAVITSSSTNEIFDYAITIVSSSTQSTKQLSLTIVTSKTTSITSLTIMACTGKILSIMKN